MLRINYLIAVGVTLIFCCDVKPTEIFENPIYENEKLLYRMAQLIDSFGGDDTDDGYDRLKSNNDDSDEESSISSASNELKNMKPGERCILPMRKGVCRALIARWTYDTITKECKEFRFGGCDGNSNNFLSRKHCMDTCNGI